MRITAEFRQAVYQVVSKIPKGKVMTYSQIASVCDNPQAAWEVGQIAHFGPMELPWQRVVNKQGGLARGYTSGGLEAHKRDLEADGIKVNNNYTIDINKYLWNPDI